MFVPHEKQNVIPQTEEAVTATTTSIGSFFTTDVIVLLVIIALYSPALIIGMQYLWTWALHDIRRTDWVKHTWLEYLSDIMIVGRLVFFLGGLCIVIPLIGLLSGTLMWVLLSSASTLVLNTIITLIGLILLPIIVYALRYNARRKEKLMSRLGQKHV